MASKPLPQQSGEVRQRHIERVISPASPVSVYMCVCVCVWLLICMYILVWPYVCMCASFRAVLFVLLYCLTDKTQEEASGL